MRLPIPRRAFLASCFITFIAGLGIFSLNRFVKDGSIIRSDGVVYFMYARSAVIDWDMDLTQDYRELDALFPSSGLVKTAVHKYARPSPNTGKIVFPWPAGSGLVMAPFYAMGYGVELLVSRIAGRKPDSYGLVPQNFYGFGALAYGLLGFWATFLCCRDLAGTRAAYASSLAMILGSPIVFYLFFSPSMAHASSFGLVSLLTLLFWRAWTADARYMGYLGLLLGIVITIRTQNALFGIPVVALALRNALRASTADSLRQSAAGAWACCIPLALEGLHYVRTNGLSWGASGADGTVFLNQATLRPTSPQFFHVLFSCDRGAFYWTPVLAIGFAGLLWASRKESWGWIFLLTFLSHVYVIGSIAGESGIAILGGSFGMRYLTECGPMLAMGLAVLIRDSGNRIDIKWWRLVLGALVAWNGLLILSYTLSTISRYNCVTYPEMVHGFGSALTRIVTRRFA